MPSKQRKTDATSAVRAAVDKTFQATVGGAQLTRGRAQELVDDVANAAGRVRTALEDLRVATGDDIRAVRSKLEELERRIAKLEGKAKTKKS